MLGAILVVAGCAAPDRDVAPPPPVPYAGSTPLRRLSNDEYLHAMHDLFGVSPAGLPTLPADTTVGGFANDARTLGPSDLRIARYEAIAFAFAGAATADDAALAHLLPCASFGTDDEQASCGRALITSFGRRAFRRPLATDEIERYARRFDGFRRAIDFRAAVQLVLMAIVQAPSFLYRIEIPVVDRTTVVADAPGVVRVSASALATRLSFLLWESVPDDELLDAAESGALLDPEVLAVEVDRMLEDPRVVDTIVDFDRQWLDVDRILSDANRTRDPAQYPDWTPQTPAALREESLRFLRWSASEGEGTIGELFTSRHAEVDPTMAAIYGVTEPDVGTWAGVELPSAQRAGILTRSAFLAGHAHSGNVSPPIRGSFVLERILCRPHLSPPAAADLSVPRPMPGEGPVTNRTLFERRTSSPTCVGCHVQVNGVGFAFEHYDAVGSFHSLDHGLPVDASGELFDVDPSGPFADALDLSERLATSQTVAACASDTWVRFALGRTLEGADAYLRHRALAALAGSGGDVRAMLRAIALSPELRVQQAVQE